MEDHKDFDNWYKTKITENDQDPPEGAWQNIADELDVNDVWHRVARELDSPRAWSPSKALYYALPALLLLLLGGAYFYFNKPDVTPSTLAVVQEVEESRAAAADVGSVEEVEKAGNVEAVQKIEEVGKGEDIEKIAGIEKVGKPGNAGSVMRKVEEAGEFAEAAGAGKEGVVAGEIVEKVIEDTYTIATKVGDLQKTEDVQADQKIEFEVAQRIEEVDIVGRGRDVQKGIDAKKEETVTPADADNRTARQGLTPVADMISAEEQEELFAVPFGEAESARYEERITASEATTRSQQDSTSAIEKHTETFRPYTEPSRMSSTSATKNHAGIPTVVMPDSMLNIYPVTVSLHPDSIKWIATAEIPQKRAYDKTFEFGITGSAKNTWLLNRRTLAGLEKHTLNTTVPDFGKDVGLMFAWNFSPALSAQAEGMFLSEAGQRYKEYRNGKYVDREVDLRYYSLNVLLKYRLSKLIADHQVNGSALIAGLYASSLNNATEIINGKTSDRRPAYHDHNYGIILGYEYNRYVLPNVILSSGLRMNYGIPNIDTSVFSTTLTGSLDLNISIRYRF